MAEEVPTIEKDPFAVRERERARKEQMVEYLGEMLIPVTEGFDQVNLDMTFSFLGNWDLFRLDNLSTSINLCQIYGLKQSKYLLRGELATLVNSRRSRDAKSMDMFTTISTKGEQKFKDETQEKKGFSWFGFGKKKT